MNRLMTKELEEKMPKLYETEDIEIEDKVALVRYFIPNTYSQWFGIEYSKEENLMFGYASIFYDPSCDEFGYFSLDELESIILADMFKVERDETFVPTTMKEIFKKIYPDNKEDK